LHPDAIYTLSPLGNCGLSGEPSLMSKHGSSLLTEEVATFSRQATGQKPTAIRATTSCPDGDSVDRKVNGPYRSRGRFP
jgi:hypothetical protein